MPLVDGCKVEGQEFSLRAKQLATGKRNCPKCGGAGARVLYYDRPEREDIVCANKTGRIIRYLLSLECDQCKLKIGGTEELRAYGIEPKEEIYRV